MADDIELDPLAGYRAALAITEPPKFAGVWQRVNAQAIDAAILAVPGLLVSAAIAARFPGLRDAEPAILFTLALLYYAVLDSRIGGGRTFGKLWIGIRVVGRDGTPVSLARAALRFLVLTLPDFFGLGALLACHPDSPDILPQLGSVATGMAVVGSQAAGLYLFLCNRRTGQALHDLAADSFVVRGQQTGALGDKTLPTRHVAVVTLLLALSMAAPAVAIRLTAQVGGVGDLLGGLSQ